MGKKRISKSGDQVEPEKSEPVKAELSQEKKEKAKLLGKIYREYSRRRYNKYKLQFPRLRESDLITKIIREWEALCEQDKLKLEKEFIETGGTQFLKDDSGSKSKSKSKSKSGQGEDAQGEVKPQEGASGEQPKKKKKRSPKVRVFVEKATDKNKSYLQDDDSNFRKEYEKVRQKGESSDNDSVAPSKIILGRKRIKKEKVEVDKKSKKSSEYLEFYKYYYNRLGAEHPRWSGQQITAIIKLLWRKRMLSGRLGKRKDGRGGRRKSLKIVSGRVAYRQSKQKQGLTREQIKANWMMLPYQSKQYWSKIGRGGSPKAPRTSKESVVSLKKVMKSGSEGGDPLIQKHLTWMSHTVSKP